MSLEEVLDSDVKKNIADHAASSIAILAVATPVNAFLETYAAGMTDDVSLNARLISAAVVFSGIGYIARYGVNIYRFCDSPLSERTWTERSRFTSYKSICFISAKAL